MFMALFWLICIFMGFFAKMGKFCSFINVHTLSRTLCFYWFTKFLYHSSIFSSIRQFICNRLCSKEISSTVTPTVCSTHHNHSAKLYPGKSFRIKNAFPCNKSLLCYHRHGMSGNMKCFCCSAALQTY